MFLCSLALIFILGLRSRYTGTMDTYFYSLVFNGAKGYSDLWGYLTNADVFDGFFLFSEAGFHVFTWLATRIFSEAQGFLLLTAAIVVVCTAIFISQNSEDPLISWITFICLGSMTFAMNGMRQALAMSICLLSYRYAREKKPLRFLLAVLIAVLFHKSAMVFLVVYLMRNMKLNGKSVALLMVGIALFVAFAERLAFLYDDMTGENYAIGEVFESGGIVPILIYLIAILLTFLFSKRLKDPDIFVPLSLVICGLAIYFGRFTTIQIYERISYYFSYFLMLIFPSVFRDIKKDFRVFLKVCFCILAIALFAYRISKGVFADFAMFWQ